MRELQGRTDIAGRVDARVGCLKPLVHPYARLRVVCDPGSVQPQAFHVRGPAHADQDLVHDKFHAPAVLFNSKDFLIPSFRSAGNPCIKPELDPVTHQCLLNKFGGIGVFPGKDVAAPLEDRDPAAYACKSLGKLAPDRPAADDCQPFRKLRQPEYVLIGQVARLLDPRNGRSRGTRTRADRSLCKAKALPLHVNAVRTRKRRSSDEHVHAQLP